jgi:hypothetical protein
VRTKLGRWLRDGESFGRDFARLFGLVLDSEAPRTIYRSSDGNPAVEVHSVRPALRRTLDGSILTDIVIEVTQRRRGYFDPCIQRAQDANEGAAAGSGKGDFTFRAGCTVLVDPRTADIRRIIRTPGTIASDRDAFDAGLPGSLAAGGRARQRDEPFALLHALEES